MLDKFSEAIRGNLTKMERLKLVALVTIEVGWRENACMLNKKLSTCILSVLIYTIFWKTNLTRGFGLPFVSH